MEDTVAELMVGMVKEVLVEVVIVAEQELIQMVLDLMVVEV